jgi:hypothetical protein
MDMEFMFMLTEPAMKVNGKSTYKKAMALKHGQMDLATKDTIKPEKSMAKGIMFGLTAQNTKVIGVRIKFRDM